MPLFREKDIEERELFPGVMLTQAIEHGNGTACVTLGKIVMQPGAEIPPHSHPVEDAMIFIAGKGVMVSGQDEVPIEAGCHSWRPANMRHAVKNTGEEPLVVIYTWPAVDVGRTLLD